MDLNSLPTEFFIAYIKSFADAFPAVTIKEEEWGVTFEWPNSKHVITNIALVKNDPSDGLDYLITWLRGDPTRKLLISEDMMLPTNIKKEFELGIYYRKQKKIKSPILDTETVRSYSYGSMSSGLDLKDIMNNVAEINEVPEESIFEFHRLIGGNLHLNEGEIWTLDNDGAILSSALTVEQSNFKNIKLIDLLATRKAVRKNGHAGNLIQSIIAKSKKIGFIIITKKTPVHENILKKFDFELTKLYNVHTLEK